jgi:hypothetical protein
MGFLIKCVICIALIYAAAQWRSAASTSGRAPAARVAAKTRVAPGSGPADVHALLRSGAEGLTASARQWCLSAPKDCVAMIQRVQPAQTRPR